MKKERDYFQDIAEIRSMMERSSKFLSLSGWAGIMAGVYALISAFVAYKVMRFDPSYEYISEGNPSSDPTGLVLLAASTLILAIGTAVWLSSRKAQRRGEKVWNATSKRMLSQMIVPLVAGGILCLILIAKNLVGFLAPFTLIFYGLALYSASKYTFSEVKSLGLIQVALGLISAYYISYSLLFWAVGFGLVHIIYGIYMHIRYER